MKRERCLWIRQFVLSKTALVIDDLTQNEGIERGAMRNQDFDWASVRQLTLLQVAAAFAIPSAIAFVGFRFVLPKIYDGGVPAVVAWPSVAAVLLLAFLVVPILFMRREAAQLNTSLKSRMCFKRLSRREWVFAIAVLIVGIVVAAGMGGLSVIWGEFTGLTVPEYFPFFLNPAINPMGVEPSVLTPGFQLKGAYWLVGLILIVLLLNILVEELYFRAWLLPKMQNLGAASWVINGSFFSFYHTFQLWLLPQILPLSLFMAFVVYKTQSIWPALVIHLIVNALTVLGLVVLVMR